MSFWTNFSSGVKIFFVGEIKQSSLAVRKISSAERTKVYGVFVEFKSIIFDIRKALVLAMKARDLISVDCGEPMKTMSGSMKRLQKVWTLDAIDGLTRKD